MSEPTDAWQQLSAGNQRFFAPLRSGRTGLAETDRPPRSSSAPTTLLQRSPLIAQRVDTGQCAIVCAVPDSGGHVEALATIGNVDAPEDLLLECV